MFQAPLTLTVSNARVALESGVQAIADGQTEIDLAPVSAVDSTAVATLLAWKREARKRGVDLKFINLSADLQSLIALYGVTDLLQGHL